MLPELERLNASYNPLADLSPLADMPRLRKVVLRMTAVVDLGPLAGHPALETLEC
jgi:Leucine-rich repeat (LRR) protein